MSSQPSLVTATVDFNREGLQHGYIRVPYSHDRSTYGHIPIPVSVALRGDGPTVLLTGGVHGDEYEGPVALMRLIREFSIERLNGRIVMIPALNFPAYLSGTRTSPIDHLDLNRRFPGDRNGMPTDMIAHYLETVLLPMADYCFDFHAGGASLRYLPTLIAERPKTDRQRCQLDALISGFHPPRVLFMDMLGEDRLIAAAAARNNVCFLTGEFGGGGSLDLDGLEILAEGLQGVLSALGVFDRGHPTRRCARGEMPRRLSVKGMDHYIFAPCPGIFEPCFRLGETVEHGRIAGYIHDPHIPWRAPVEIRFAGSGIALCIRTTALVAAGDCLGHLASDEP
jgi:hypothetical protein